VQRRGVRVSTISTIRTTPPLIADELRRQSDQFIDLAELHAFVARQRAAEPAGSGRDELIEEEDEADDLG
jgi:uncharacterized LabA/DUF88 family protein